ncbi:MAG: hypothetical protein B1H03_00985 [Planctomycetales bacterium 4484_113]|nr:MAG: hypothetical protein B1H03_00985 [Planctomycetales bacterium 4484_113]
MSLMRIFGREHPVRTLRDELDRLFGDFFEESSMEGKGSLARWAPRADVKEDEKAFYLKADLPGMKKEDIDISVENNQLVVTGERSFSKEEKKEDYHFVERSYGKFYRAFTLPGSVDVDNIKATYQDGVLEVELPKKEEVKPKKVSIK